MLRGTGQRPLKGPFGVSFHVSLAEDKLAGGQGCAAHGNLSAGFLVAGLGERWDY